MDAYTKEIIATALRRAAQCAEQTCNEFPDATVEVDGEKIHVRMMLLEFRKAHRLLAQVRAE